MEPVIDSLDGLSEQDAALYEKRGEKYVLSVIPSDWVSPEDVKGLVTAIAKERENVRSLKEERKVLRDAVLEYEGAEGDSKKGKGGKRLSDQEREGYEKALREANERTEALAASVARSSWDGTVAKAILEAGGRPELLEPVISKFTNQRRLDDGRIVHELMDENGVPRLNQRGEPMTPLEFIHAMKEQDVYAAAFDGSGASGSGNFPKGRSGTLPVGQLTQEQMEDPAQYRAAKEAAEKAGQPFVPPDWGK